MKRRSEYPSPVEGNGILPMRLLSIGLMPLDHLRDPARVRWATRTRRGEPIDYPYIAIDDHAIWGATAMVLSEAIALFDSEE